MQEKRFYVYVITNLINNKKYVGKTNDLKVRWRKHKMVSRGGKEKYPDEFSVIHDAINKYGIDNFKIDILEEFDDENAVYEFETWWIDFLGTHTSLNNGYNCNYGGKGSFIPNEETRKKLIAAANRPEKLAATSAHAKKMHADNPGFLARLHIGVPTSEKQKAAASLASRGSNRKNSKLKDFQVLEIRRKYASGKYTHLELAKEYNIIRRYVGDIISRKVWKHI